MRYDKYDTKGACHWRSYTRSKSYRGLVEASLIPFIQEPRGSILELGCGDGVSACKLAQLGYKVIGVEIEPKGIQLAKEKCSEDVEWVCKSIEDFYKDCSSSFKTYDYLYSLDTIEHLDDPSIMVKMMASVKKFGIIITDDKDKMTIKEPNPYHKEELTRSDFKKLFKGYWLDEIPLLDERFFGFKVHSKL